MTNDKEYTAKYKVYPRIPEYEGKRGRPTTVAHDWANDRRYAWMKHQAQARFRNEAYALTLKDWEALWPKELWMQRGRRKHDLTLYRVDATQPWNTSNVQIVEQQHKGKFYQKDRPMPGRPRGAKNK